MLKKSVIAAVLAIAGLQGISAVAAAAPAAPAAAPVAKAGKSPLTVQLSVKKVVIENDKEVLADAANAAPGDVLEYRAEYKNIGQAALGKIALTLPLPAHTSYVDGSALPASMTASNRSAIADFKSPPLLPQTEDDGIGALRWSVGKLAPGQSAVVSARVRIDLPAQPQPTAGDTFK
ncbi:DUF11 domain-containing protein [Oxalobacteraceae bacterium CAVE-383]|nr:DUF11 domain-containing protein [Oxalobacteraceae bacterium CAVE-383]